MSLNSKNKSHKYKIILLFSSNSNSDFFFFLIFLELCTLARCESISEVQFLHGSFAIRCVMMFPVRIEVVGDKLVIFFVYELASDSTL